MPKITHEPPSKVKKGSKILVRITMNTRNNRDVFCYFYAHVSGEVVDISEDLSSVAIELHESFTDSKYIPTGPLIFETKDWEEYQCRTIKKPNTLVTIDHKTLTLSSLY